MHTNHNIQVYTFLNRHECNGTQFFYAYKPYNINKRSGNLSFRKN